MRNGHLERGPHCLASFTKTAVRSTKNALRSSRKGSSLLGVGKGRKSHSLASINNARVTFLLDQAITVSDATGGSFMITLDLTASGGSVQTSGEIAYNADATGGRTSVQGILEVLRRMCCRVCCKSSHTTVLLCSVAIKPAVL